MGNVEASNRRHRWRYTLWAPFYDRLVASFDHMRQRSLTLAAIESGERVLIVGAGTGLDLAYLPSGCHVTAIDLTPSMLGRLRERARRLGVEVGVHVMDGHALEFPDASFDVAVLHLILAVIPDPSQCLKEVERVLRPGGRVVVMDKFLSDERPTPLLLRLLNPFARFFGTDATRRLGPIVFETGLRVLYEEPLGLRGYFKTALLEKRQNV